MINTGEYFNIYIHQFFLEDRKENWHFIWKTFQKLYSLFVEILLNIHRWKVFQFDSHSVAKSSYKMQTKYYESRTIGDRRLTTSQMCT